MKIPSPWRQGRRFTMLLVGGMCSHLIQGCADVPELRKENWRAFTLSPNRPEGTWRTPQHSAERQQLNQVLREHFSEFQECSWRYAGIELSRTDGSSVTHPMVVTIGVDALGKVTWLELNQQNFQRYSLRECLSRSLVKLTFNPPPTEPVMLVFTLSQPLLR